MFGLSSTRTTTHDEAAMRHRYVDNRYKVSFAPDAARGVRYLEYDLDRSEARVFFDEARRRGEADFEDHAGRNYRLRHERGHDYVLERR